MTAYPISDAPPLLGAVALESLFLAVEHILKMLGGKG